MAKNKNVKQKKSNNAHLESLLPQNIVEYGEHSQEDKKIYISQDAYKEIHRFTKDKTKNESGGFLLGNVIEEFGKTHIIIRAFVEAKYCEGTPTTLKFTHETWDYIHKEAERKYAKYTILGWIHTHPDFGIFLSEYDKFIQENFFRGENQIAYVVDPIQGIEGFYFWINDKLERCKGFYVFDRPGVRIKANTESVTKDAAEAPAKAGSSVKNIVIGVLGAAVVLLMAFGVVLNERVNNLSKEVDNLRQQIAAVMDMNDPNSMIYQINVIAANFDARISALEADAAQETETPPQTEPPAAPGEETETESAESGAPDE